MRCLLSLIWRATLMVAAVILGVLATRYVVNYSSNPSWVCASAPLLCE